MHKSNHKLILLHNPIFAVIKIGVILFKKMILIGSENFRLQHHSMALRLKVNYLECSYENRKRGFFYIKAIINEFFKFFAPRYFEKKLKLLGSSLNLSNTYKSIG